MNIIRIIFVFLQFYNVIKNEAVSSRANYLIVNYFNLQNP